MEEIKKKKKRAMLNIGVVKIPLRLDPDYTQRLWVGFRTGLRDHLINSGPSSEPEFY